MSTLKTTDVFGYPRVNYLISRVHNRFVAIGFNGAIWFCDEKLKFEYALQSDAHIVHSAQLSTNRTLLLTIASYKENGLTEVSRTLAVWRTIDGSRFLTLEIDDISSYVVCARWVRQSDEVIVLATQH